MLQAIQLPLVVRPAQEAHYYEVRRGANRLGPVSLGTEERSALLNLCTSTSAAGSVWQGRVPLLDLGNDVRVSTGVVSGDAYPYSLGCEEGVDPSLPLMLCASCCVSDSSSLQKRKPFDIWSFVKSPYGIMIVFSVFAIVVFPRLKMDPEDYKVREVPVVPLRWAVFILMSNRLRFLWWVWTGHTMWLCSHASRWARRSTGRATHAPHSTGTSTRSYACPVVGADGSFMPTRHAQRLGVPTSLFPNISSSLHGAFEWRHATRTRAGTPGAMGAAPFNPAIHPFHRPRGARFRCQPTSCCCSLCR